MANKTYGYLRTSSRRRDRKRAPTRDPKATTLGDGVSLDDILEDVGVSGSTATSSRKGWNSLNSRLKEGDTVVVAALDRIGRPGAGQGRGEDPGSASPG